jgi:hypothetical protein
MRSSSKQSSWSRKVRRRDGRCDICLTTENLTAHHLNSADTRIRYSTDNGVTLCATCHQRFHQSHWNINKKKPSRCTATDYVRYRQKTIAKYCRKQGKEAFHAGLSRCDNPYITTEHYLWWDRAFRYEQQQATLSFYGIEYD